MEKKGFWFILATAIILIFFGCAKEQKSLDGKGIKILSLVSTRAGVKGEENNFDKQRFIYYLTLHNYEDENFFVKSVEPVFGEKIQDRIVSKNVKVLVNREIKSKQSLSVSGEIIIDTENLSKEEIIAIEHYIKEFKIVEKEL